MIVMDPEPTGWDIVSGIGITALGVAAMRAIEGHHAEPLVRDPYAAAFVKAAADQLPRPMPVTPEESAADPGSFWPGITHYIAVRSRFVDDFFAAAARAGLRQTVIVAAGFDTRPFRLDWMPGATVYEIDAPMILAFKDSVLTAQGAGPRCVRRTVTADLRADWPTALRDAGFDPATPTAWLAEGLFPYPTDEAMNFLLGHLHELSAPGSWITADHIPGGTNALGGSLARDIASGGSEELTAIWIADQHHDPASWLLGHGWTTDVSLVSWIAAAYGRPMTDLQPENLRGAQLITGELRE